MNILVGTLTDMLSILERRERYLAQADGLGPDAGLRREEIRRVREHVDGLWANEVELAYGSRGPYTRIRYLWVADGAADDFIMPQRFMHAGRMVVMYEPYQQMLSDLLAWLMRRSDLLGADCRVQAMELLWCADLVRSTLMKAIESGVTLEQTDDDQALPLSSIADTSFPVTGFGVGDCIRPYLPPMVREDVGEVRMMGG